MLISNEYVDSVENKFVRNPFMYVEVNDYKIPSYGWKVHVSATRHNFEKVLDKVSKFCVHCNICFKYICTYERFFYNISKDEFPEISGKFITIYPKSKEHAYAIMCHLANILKYEKGPLVLSDFEFRDSNIVFFRYGILTKHNDDVIVGPENKRFKDLETDFPRLPDWVNLPKGWTTNQDEKLITKYHPTEIIRKKNSGNIFLGHSETEPVVIKEVRKYIEEFTGVDATELQLNAWLISRQITPFAASPVEAIETRSSIYYVYSKANGISLEEMVSESSFLVEKNRAKRIKSVVQTKRILVNLWRNICLLHDRGYQNFDIHPGNVFATSDGSVQLIDMETVNRTDYTSHTPGFWSSKIRSDSASLQDIRRFGFLVMYCFGRANKHLDQLKVEDTINLTDVMVKPIGHIKGLHELLVELLLSSSPQINKISEYLTQLQFRPSSPTIDSTMGLLNDKTIVFVHAQEIAHSLGKIAGNRFFNLDSGQKEYEMADIQLVQRMSKNPNSYETGFGGLSFGLYRCQLDINNFRDEIKKIQNAVSSRVVSIDREQYVSIYSDEQVISPYLLAGEAGYLIINALLPTSFQLGNEDRLCESLVSDFAKDYDYYDGLLGVADALMTIGVLRDNEKVRSGALRMLKQLSRISLVVNGQAIYANPKAYYNNQIDVVSLNSVLSFWHVEGDLI